MSYGFIERIRKVLTMFLAGLGAPAARRRIQLLENAANYKFTDRVRKVLVMAREAAISMGRDYIGTEHILLGLINEGEGVAAAMLRNLSVDLEQVRQKVEERARRGGLNFSLGELPYTSGAKEVLFLATDEARALNQSYLSTEHLLLALLREKKGVAAIALGQLGVTLEGARREARKLLSAGPPPEGRETTRPDVT